VETGGARSGGMVEPTITLLEIPSRDGERCWMPARMSAHCSQISQPNATSYLCFKELLLMNIHSSLKITLLCLKGRAVRRY
jgi:hypothetical protein